MALVDLHLHLLPGIDDGARTLEESVAHARRMVADGVAEATVTPHVHPAWPLDLASLASRVATLREALAAAEVELAIRPGGELDASTAGGLGRAELELVAHGPAGRRWVLVETPWGGVDADFLAVCRDLRARGFGALVAHPERSARFAPAGLERLRPELAAGSLLQVNVCSLLGRHGPEIRRVAEYLVRTRLAFVLASDGHPGTREHTLRAGEELALRAGASPLAARRLTRDNPRFLLDQGISPIRADSPADAALIARS